MTQEDYRNDMLYHAALSMGKQLLEKGLISQKEYARAKAQLLKKYDPYLGKLLSESACFVTPSERLIDAPKGGIRLENHRDDRG